MAVIKGSRSILFWKSIPGGLPSIVDVSKFSGNVFFVDSNAGQASDSEGSGYHPDAPFATIDYAIGQCTANQGDVILALPGHAETIATAGAIAGDVVGVTVIGLGTGAARPILTFNGVVGASVLVTAASFKMLNLIGVAGLDGLTNPLHVQAADCQLDIEWQDGSAAIEAARVLLTTAAADRIKANIVHRGYISGNACVNSVRLVGVDNGEINVDFYGVASTAVVEFHTTACHNIKVNGVVYNSGTTDGSKDVVDTVGGSTWGAQIWDATAGLLFSGGSGKTLAAADIKTVTDALYGATGISTYPSAAVAANGVSMAEVIRYVEEQQLWRLATKAYTFAGQGGVQGAISLFTVTGDVEVEIFGVCKADFTSGGVATIAVGVGGNTAVLIAQATATDLINNEIWHDATPTTTVETISTVTGRRFVITNGQDIIMTVGTADLTAGSCTFYCRWRPLSSDGALVAA